VISHRSDLRPRPAVAGWLSRLIDLSVGGLALVVLGPAMLLTALIVRLTSPGPALFRQVRVGYLEQPFVMLKFRTMRAGCDDTVHREYNRRELSGEDPRDSGRGLYKLDRDDRITPIGHFLRKSSLDELPQLINVMRGEMALVGPRPALAWEVELYRAHHHERFLVKTGITGLWQVSGRNRLSMIEALDLDVEYVRRRSVGLDVRILARTLPAVLNLGSTR